MDSLSHVAQGSANSAPTANKMVHPPKQTASRYTADGPVEKTRYCGAFTLTFPEGLNLKVSGAPCVLGEGRSLGHEVDGILGVKIMKAMNAVLDFDAGKMTFTVKAASN